MHPQNTGKPIQRMVCGAFEVGARWCTLMGLEVGRIDQWPAVNFPINVPLRESSTSSMAKACGSERALTTLPNTVNGKVALF